MRIFDIIEDQRIVNFTGKLNILKKTSGESVGTIIFFDGEIINTEFRSMSPLRGLIHLCIESETEENIKFIVEPELIEINSKKITMPFSVIKKKINTSFNKFIEAKSLRPPNNLKILPKPDIMRSEEIVSPDEFSILCTLSDYNNVSDIYIHNELMEYEITNALISLRKKNAIKLVQLK